MLTAKRCSLPFVVVPDTWLLLPEPDPRDKRIGELEQKIQELERSHPQISMTAKSLTGECLELLPIGVTTYDLLPEQVVKELLAEVKELHPMATEFNKSEKDRLIQASAPSVMGYYYKAASEFKIQQYKETDYPQWLEKIENFFQRLHIKLERPTHLAKFSFCLSNEGTVPAENILVEFHTLGGPLLKLPMNEGDETPGLRILPPPIPPDGKWIDRYALMDPRSSNFDPDVIRRLMPPIVRRQERDKHAFYSRSGSSSSSTECVSFECDEFRHKVSPEIFDIVIVVPSKHRIEKGAIGVL
jgi:hypothetical protein